MPAQMREKTGSKVGKKEMKLMKVGRPSGEEGEGNSRREGAPSRNSVQSFDELTYNNNLSLDFEDLDDARLLGLLFILSMDGDHLVA
jgi:hypothetical protein